MDGADVVEWLVDHQAEGLAGAKRARVDLGGLGRDRVRGDVLVLEQDLGTAVDGEGRGDEGDVLHPDHRRGRRASSAAAIAGRLACSAGWFARTIATGPATASTRNPTTTPTQSKRLPSTQPPSATRTAKAHPRRLPDTGAASTSSADPISSAAPVDHATLVGF